jgi:hypothetical protein
LTPTGPPPLAQATNLPSLPFTADVIPLTSLPLLDLLITNRALFSRKTTDCLPAILYGRTVQARIILTCIQAQLTEQKINTAMSWAHRNSNTAVLSSESFKCGGELGGVAIVIRVWCCCLMGSKRYSDDSINLTPQPCMNIHISCLFRTSEKTLAIILELLHLRFPRLPHGPVLSKQSGELRPLLLL